MIRIICPKCGSKLNAKPELIGQSRPCPKCREPVKIVAPETVAEESQAVEEITSAVEESPASVASIPLDEPDSTQSAVGNKMRLQSSQHLMKKLDRHNRYWICDHSHIVAVWASDGKGWLLKTNAGTINASRNREKVPNQGNFVMVELKMEASESGMKLRGITAYNLPPRWALPAITEGDNQICNKITGYGVLTKEQKGVIKLAIREQLMHEIWEGATKVLEYLSNADFHTHSVVEA